MQPMHVRLFSVVLATVLTGVTPAPPAPPAPPAGFDARAEALLQSLWNAGHGGRDRRAWEDHSSEGLWRAPSRPDRPIDFDIPGVVRDARRRRKAPELRTGPHVARPESAETTSALWCAVDKYCRDAAVISTLRSAAAIPRTVPAAFEDLGGGMRRRERFDVMASRAEARPYLL